MGIGSHNYGDWQMLLLLNQAWVHLPATQQRQSTDTRIWWRKGSIYHRCQARRMGSLCSKDAKSPATFRARLLKATLGVRVAACMINLQTFFWLVGGEVTDVCFRNLNHHPDGPKQSEVYMFMVSMYSLSTTWIEVLISVNNSKMCFRLL